VDAIWGCNDNDNEYYNNFPLDHEAHAKQFEKHCDVGKKKHCVVVRNRNGPNPPGTEQKYPFEKETISTEITSKHFLSQVSTQTVEMNAKKIYTDFDRVNERHRNIRRRVIVTHKCCSAF
jgi:hypothetical protein